MIDFFDNIYYKIRPSNRHKFFLFPILRFITRILANSLLKYYFLLTKNDKKYCISPPSDTKPRIIVSLTSFPERINNLWMVIETLLRQQQKPDRIILWLSKEQHRSINELPKKLIDLQLRGLEIRFCEGDLRSHKKYFYALQEFKTELVITVDDDVLYNSKIISTLLELHLKFPKCVCCNHSSIINFRDNIIQPYKTWKECTKSNIPSQEIFPIGVGGILYPPNSISKHAFNIVAIESNCLLADDIWLNVMTKINDNMVVSSNLKTYYLPVLYKNKTTLTSKNVNQGLNDKQLEDVKNYCITELGINPFKDISKL